MKRAETFYTPGHPAAPAGAWQQLIVSAACHLSQSGPSRDLRRFENPETPPVNLAVQLIGMRE